MQMQLEAPGVLVQEGCPWARNTAMELYLALNNQMAEMGFAFGHGEFDRAKAEAKFLSAASSPLADEIQKCGLIKDEFEVRVTRGLHDAVAAAIAHSGDWAGYAWDIGYMSTSSAAWEFATGECLYGCHITEDLRRGQGLEPQWLVSGLMDPGMWLQGKEGWVTFGLAEEMLGKPEEIEGLTYDSVCAKAFGTDADEVTCV